MTVPEEAMVGQEGGSGGGDPGDAKNTSDDNNTDENDDNGFGVDEESKRLYGYGETERSGDGSSSHLNNRMNRRNVVTAEASRFEISYHPGRVLSTCTVLFLMRLNCSGSCDTHSCIFNSHGIATLRASSTKTTVG